MKIAWVTDSTCYVDHTVKESMEDLYVVPLSVIIAGDEYHDGVDLTSELLYQKIKETTDISTSQPSIGSFHELYKKLAREYDYIFSIHLSSKLSGTYTTALQASQLVNDVPITVLDSKTLSYPLTELLLLGKQHAKSGLDPDEIKTRLLDTIETSEAYVMVSSLEQLHRSGRMNGISFFLGSMLQIKPILSVEKGSLSVKEKVRSTKKGFSKMVEYLEKSLTQSSISEVCLLYGRDELEANERKKSLSSTFPNIRFHTCQIGTIIGVHGGENTLGMAWFRKKY